MPVPNKSPPSPPMELTGLLPKLWERCKASVAPTNEAAATVVADQIRLTRGATPLIDMLTPIAAVLVAFTCRHWVDMPRMIAWVGAVALSCATTSLAAYFTNPLLKGDLYAVRRAAQIRTVTTAVYLSAWATMGLALWVPDNPTDHMFLVMVLATTLAGASSLLAAHPASVASAIAILGGMLVLRPALSGTPQDLALAGLGFVFTILMGGQVRAVYAMTSRARELEFERRRTLSELRRAKAESDREHAKAVEAGRTKSEFLANMSHELRTPMNAVLGFSEIIKSKSFGDNVERYVQYGALIYESGEHLLALINDMLDLAKIEGGKPTLEESTFALGPLLHNIVAEHQHQAAQAQLTLSLHAAPQLPAIEADRRAISNILRNLLSNALKFTPPDGQIHVSAAVESDGRIALNVEDNGIGIALEDQLNVFERFGRKRHDITTPDQGTGLGLAIVKGFTEAHDGEVALESAPGVGTRVSVYLPATRIREGLDDQRATG